MFETSFFGLFSGIFGLKMGRNGPKIVSTKVVRDRSGSAQGAKTGRKQPDWQGVLDEEGGDES